MRLAKDSALEQGHSMLCPYSLNTGYVTMIYETQ